MGIKTVPLKELETNLQKALSDCADAGATMVVELPDHRLLAIQPLDPTDDDDLVNQLLESNSSFRELIAKSKAGSRKPFAMN